MVELAFRIAAMKPVTSAVSPYIGLSLEVSCANPHQQIESVLLRCTVRIDAAARKHDPAERERLRELFGGAGVWERSSKSLLWTETTAVLPGFCGVATVDLLLAASYDLEHATSRYLSALGGGEAPIVVHFRGTIFHRSASGLEVAQIPWDREARFRMPVACFREALERHYSNAAVVPLRRDVFERLDRYRAAQGLATWELAVERLLGAGPSRGSA